MSDFHTPEVPTSSSFPLTPTSPLCLSMGGGRTPAHLARLEEAIAAHGLAEPEAELARRLDAMLEGYSVFWDTGVVPNIHWFKEESNHVITMDIFP